MDSLFSQKLLNIIQIGDIVNFLFKYASIANIPIDIYKLIQAFFNYFNILPDSGLDEFWTVRVSYSENSRLLQRMIDVLGNLLDKLWKNLNAITDIAKQTNTILAKLCLMIYIHPKFQLALQSDANGRQMSQNFFIKILEALVQLFVNCAAYFDSNDEHFIEKLHDFMNYRSNFNGNGQVILQILAYVFNLLQHM